MIALILSTPPLVLLSAAALALSLLIYVLLDGTDLGAGLLCAFVRRPEERQMINISLLPVWDGNETWLVLAAGGMLALFPPGYAILLSALYLPVFLMLIGLILRSVAIEYRHHQPRLFDALLVSGSLLATLSQGAMMGAWLEGIPHNGAQFTGSGLEWLSPFALYCALALTTGYGLLGACWLNWRCAQPLAGWGRRQALWLAPLTVLLLIGLVGWTSRLAESYRLHLLMTGYSLPLALLAALALAGLLWGLWRRRPFLPMVMALLLVVAAFGMLLLALFPWLLPPGLLLTQAAAPPATLKLMLIAFAILVPITLLYNSWGFWLFRGRIRPPGGE